MIKSIRKVFHFCSLIKLTMEYKIMDVNKKIVPRMVAPAAISAMFVIIVLCMENSCNVQTIKNNPTMRKTNPGIP